LSDIEILSLRIEMAIRSKIPSLIIPHSSSEIGAAKSITSTTKMNALRNIKWRQPAFRIDRNRQRT